MWLRNYEHWRLVMTVTTLSGRELNQDLGRAKRATKEGPVIITDRGRPAHVLLSFDEYKRLTGKMRTLGDMLAAPGAEDVELPLPGRMERARPVDLS
jgi:prevent-host-death family protein